MNKKNKGYITVEASLVVPMFLFFFLAMVEMVMLLMAEAHIHQALAAATDYVAQHCYLEQKILQKTSEKKKEQRVTTDVETLVDKALLWKQFQDYLGEDFYVDRMISGGKSGIVVTVEQDKENQKVIQSFARYKAEAHLPLLGTYSINLSNQIKQKSFVGFSEEELYLEDSYVFVTPNREAYHLRRDCTHLMLKVKNVSASQKGRYNTCYYCGESQTETGIYIAENGQVYHSKRDCIGLKRTVRRVKRSSVEGLGACSRCGK